MQTPGRNNKRSQVIDGLVSNDGLDKSGESHHYNQFSIPNWDLPGCFVPKGMKILSPKAPNRKGQPKILYGEGGSMHRDTVENVIKVNLPTPDRHDDTLLEVCAKTCGITKPIDDGCKVLNVLLDKAHKNSRVIFIDRDVLKMVSHLLILRRGPC
jgi:hypothetical protein